MTNNDILRRIRYTFNFNDKKMIALFALADLSVTREQVSQWLKKDDDADFANCSDSQLATFLNGFINDKRGKKEGPQHPPESRLNNNLILNKLKIALNLKAEDIVDLLKTTDLAISKAELSAFFRKPDHKHYRECKDQFLRNFLQALQIKYRTDMDSNPVNKSQTKSTSQSHAKQAPRASTNKTPTKTKAKTTKTIYVNPNATVVEKPQSKRKVLKLKPEDIWKQ